MLINKRRKNISILLVSEKINLFGVFSQQKSKALRLFLGDSSSRKTGFLASRKNEATVLPERENLCKNKVLPVSFFPKEKKLGSKS